MGQVSADEGDSAALPRPQIVTTSDEWSAAICDRLDALLARDAGPVVGKGIKVSEPATEAAHLPHMADAIRVDSARSRTRTRQGTKITRG